MKKLIFAIIVVVGLYFAWDYFAPKKETVEVPSAEFEGTVDLIDTMTTASNKMREELFQVLMLMNDVTVNTMLLEQEKEGGKDVAASVNEQLEGRMELLKKQLDIAREHAKENKELTAELNRLEQSFKNRESTIKRLKAENREIDEQLKQAIEDLETETAKLNDENIKLAQNNLETQRTIAKRKQTDMNSWEKSGDELKEAARIIPKAHSPLFAGKQSREITRSKQMILKSATECYNNAIRLANSYGNKKDAERAHAKALEADRLFKLVTNYESIGEDD